MWLQLNLFLFLLSDKFLLVEYRKNIIYQQVKSSSDSSGKLMKTERKQIGDWPALTAETLAIQNTITASLRIRIDNIILESDSQVAINSIIGKS